MLSVRQKIVATIIFLALIAGAADFAFDTWTQAQHPYLFAVLAALNLRFIWLVWRRTATME